MQEWMPSSLPQPSTHLLSNRSHSVDPSSTGLFSTYPSQQPSHSLSLDNHQYHSQGMPSFRSNSSLGMNFLDHQHDVQPTLSKDSIERANEPTTSTSNEALSRYVKMLLERSPNQEKNAQGK